MYQCPRWPKIGPRWAPDGPETASAKRQPRCAEMAEMKLKRSKSKNLRTPEDNEGFTGSKAFGKAQDETKMGQEGPRTSQDEPDWDIY